MLGNVTAIIILFRHKMNKLGPRYTYLYLFISDFSFLPFILVNNFGYVYDITILSKYACKMYWYLNYVLASISPWLLLYISVEKLVSIKYPGIKFFLRNKNNQLMYLLIFIAFNSVYYLPIVYYLKIYDLSINETNTTINCDFIDSNKRQLIFFMDTSNRVFVPFFLMTGFSLRLLLYVFRMRTRIMNNFRSNNNIRLSRKIQIAFSLIVLNFFFIALNIPNVIYSYSKFGFEYIFTLYIFYLTYALNFYIIFLTNSIFRQECLVVFSKLKYFKIF